MKRGLRVGGFELFWLNGGTSGFDGGAIFGVVPKALWSKKYPSDEENYIIVRNSPMLVKAPGALVLVETGLGNKLTDKQREIFRVKEQWSVPGDLEALGMTRRDVTHVVLTHCDFDHAGGIVMFDEKGAPELAFPEAEHIVQKSEWEDAMNPDRRASHTYWPINFEQLKKNGNLYLVEGDATVVEGVRVLHTGGHTSGHQAVKVESEGRTALHMGDLLPTHVHFNPLWVTAYDNFPLESIKRKEEMEKTGIGEGAWFTFYHDPFMYACRFDEEGNVVEKFEG